MAFQCSIGNVKLLLNIQINKYICPILLKRNLRTDRSSVVKWLKVSQFLKEESSKPESVETFQKNITTADRLARIRKRKRPELVPTRGDRGKVVLYETQYQKLAEAVTPLSSLKYTDQLNIKYKRMKQILRDYASKLKQSKAPVKIDGTGLPCVLKDIIPSPVIDNYRNKDEFRIQKGVDGNPKTVGFLIGHLSDGTAICVNPINLPNIKSSHVKIALAFQDYIRKSPLPACLEFHDGGHWRGITVRSNLAGDLMGIVIIHPQQIVEEDLEREKNLLMEYFKNGPGKECNFKSLYFQACRQSRCTSEDSPFHLLFGQSHLYEKILDLTFRISPDAFFQVNTMGAACLYKAVQEITNIDRETIVLDICCGTGTIGLLLAGQARGLIGIETVYQAVEDAKYNAKLNGIKNAVYYHGRAEKVLPKVITEFDKRHKLIAIVNPGRSGLHPAVVKAIKSCEQIKTVVYLSCNPQGETTTNIINFGARNDGKWGGKPLVPKLAVPVDMFPHTEHCELIIVLERMRK